jgi:hypothetical protein
VLRAKTLPPTVAAGRKKQLLAETALTSRRRGRHTPTLPPCPLTWCVIAANDDLEKAFKALMRRQPPKNQVAPEVLAGAERIRWSALFNALRDPRTLEIADLHPMTEQVVEALLSAPCRGSKTKCSP